MEKNTPLVNYYNDENKKIVIRKHLSSLLNLFLAHYL